MTAYTIFEAPDDMPEVPFVVRLFTITGSHRAGVVPGPIVGWANSIDSARMLIPASHNVCIPRSPDDVRSVMETWM